MSVESTERDTIAEIIADARTTAWMESDNPTETIMNASAADRLLGVFDITPRKKRRTRMSEEQRLIGLLWGEIALLAEARVVELMRREGLYDVWEQALDAAMEADA